MRKRLLSFSTSLVLAGGQGGLSPGPVAAQQTLDIPFVVPNACPYECCAYGIWETLDSIPVLGSERGNRITSWLEPGSKFEALSGSLFVDQSGLVVMRDSLERLAPVGLEPGEYLQPGDTVHVLDHSSEGYYRLWHDGEFFYEHYFWQDSTRYVGSATPRNYPGELIRYPHQEWWVRVHSGGDEGWINAYGPGRWDAPTRC